MIQANGMVDRVAEIAEELKMSNLQPRSPPAASTCTAPTALTWRCSAGSRPARPLMTLSNSSSAYERSAAFQSGDCQCPLHRHPVRL